MRTFKFSLENVMEWHGRRSEEERRKLEHLHAVRADLRRDREAVESELLHLHAQLTSARLLSAEEVSQVACYSSALRDRGQRMRAHETICDSEIAAQLDRCIDADRQYKLLEKCKARRRAEWQRDLDRENETVAAASFLSNWSRQRRS